MPTKTRPIFITGRFRSGTSFLWQLFNELEGFCAWYEPLHPQLLQAIKHTVPKEEHVGVTDYWETYRNHPRFDKYYTKQFATEYMYLEAQQRDPQLKIYIKHLIELSGDDVPVLQFNRVDFRLHWLRFHFPDAIIVHIERNPIQLYESQRKHIDQEFRHQADYWDAYELAQWSYALHDVFPFLQSEDASQHAFYRFYSLYQLSKTMAKVHADVSINLDVDVFQSEVFIQKLNQVIPLNRKQKQSIRNRVHVPKLSEFDQTNSAHLVEIMTDVDLLLADAGLLDNFGQKSLHAIKFLYADFWQKYENQASGVEQLLLIVDKMLNELQRIDAENQELKAKAKEFDLVLAEHVVDFEFVKGLITAAKSQPTITSSLNLMSDLNGQMTQVLAFNRTLNQSLIPFKDN